MPCIQTDGQIYNALATKLMSWACLIQIQCSMIIRMPLYLLKSKINVSFHHISYKLLKQDHRHTQRTPNIHTAYFVLDAPEVLNILWSERENQRDATVRRLFLTISSRTVTFTVLAPTRQRPTAATNHIQQNQRSTPHAVTYVLFAWRWA